MRYKKTDAHPSEMNKSFVSKIEGNLCLQLVHNEIKKALQ